MLLCAGNRHGYCWRNNGTGERFTPYFATEEICKKFYDYFNEHCIEYMYLSLSEEYTNFDNYKYESVQKIAYDFGQDSGHKITHGGDETIYEYFGEDIEKQKAVNKEEDKYLELLSEVLHEGKERKTRNATTKGLFFRTMNFDLSNGTIPLLTTKKVSFKNIVYELLWFLSGSTNTKDLSKHGVKIWDANGSKDFIESQGLDYPEGTLGPLYGHQFRNNGAEYGKPGFDQIKYCQDLIRNDPTSRRICMTAWAPFQISQMVLSPCHGTVIQFYVSDGSLDIYTHQRSADLFLGVPYNIASYALLLHMMATTCDLKPGQLHYTFGDLHLYDNQYEAADIQSLRNSKPFPTVSIKTKKQNIWEYEYTDFVLDNYTPNTEPLPKVKMIA